MTMETKKRAKQNDRKTASSKQGINTTPMYILFIASLILYIIFQHTTILADIFGLAAFILIILLVIFEFSESIKKEGLKRSALEVGAVIIAVVIIWIAARVLLNSNNPIDVVPSCSMLPYLSRGDIIVLHGISSYSQIKAPVVFVSASAFNSMYKNITSEFLECVAYSNVNGTTYISQNISPGYSIGLYGPLNGGSIVPYSSQSKNLIKYTCGSRQERAKNGSMINISYTTSITIGNTTIRGDRNNSIVVYSTILKDVFYQEGDAYIVHRAYAIINASGQYYVLTKGDNNPGLDIQYGNYPSALSALQGEVVESIPYLGYVKLILSNDFGQPQGCSSEILH